MQPMVPGILIVFQNNPIIFVAVFKLSFDCSYGVCFAINKFKFNSLIHLNSNM